MYSCFKIKDENQMNKYTKDDYLRNVMVALTLNDESPIDILESKFGEIRKDEIEFITTEVDVSINYVYQVGNDRQEEYFEDDIRYISGEKRVVGKIRKFRTITDWTPVTGNNSTQEIVTARNNDDAIVEIARDNYYVPHIVATTPNSSFIACESPNGEICAMAQETISRYAQKKCFEDVCTSAKTKNENYSGKAKITSVHGVIIPEYRMEYTYKDAQYKTKGYANVSAPVECVAPIREGFKSNNTFKKQPLKPFIISAILVFLLGVVIDALCSTWVVSFISLVVDIVLVIIYFVLRKRTKKENEMKREEDRRMQREEKIMARREKKNRLEVALRKYGFKPLSENEEAKFAELDNN